VERETPLIWAISSSVSGMSEEPYAGNAPER
jgi:hypothetical protein